MRFERIELQSFGCFENLRLELGDRGGLHLIYGPNEAGKSTILTALRYFLFGIPHQIDQSYRFANSQIRLRGALRNDRGQPLELVRRKGHKNNSLRDAHDDQAVPEERLSEFLGGATASIFESSFGLDHPRLVAGGRDVVEGRGDLGELLFAARGGGGLKALQNRLEQEAGDLFKFNGRNQVVPKLLSRFNDLRQKVREAKVSPRDWKRASDCESQLRRRKQDLVDLRERWRARQRLVDRLRKALRLIPRRDHLAQQQAALSRVRLLAADFRARRASLDTRQAEARASSQTLWEELRRRRDKLAAMPEPRVDLLAIRESIEPLRERGPNWTAVERDRQVVERDLREAEAAVQHALAQAGAVADTQVALAPLASGPRLHELASRFGELQKGLKQKSMEVGELEHDEQVLKEKIEALPEADLDAGTRQAVQQARREGDLDRRRNLHRASLARRQEELGKAASRLPGWFGDWTTLELLSVPAEATVAKFAQQWSELSAQWRDARKLARQAQQEWEDQDQRRLDLSLDGQLPSEHDLTDARRLRDQGWTAVLDAWKSSPAGQPSPASEAFIQECLAHLDEAKNIDGLAEMFRLTVLEVDRIADQLRRQADRVAELSQLAARQVQLRVQHERELLEAHRLKEQLDSLQREWRLLWSESAVDPKSPLEMAAWLQELDRIRLAIQELRREEFELQSLEQLMREHLSRLRRWSGLSPAENGEDLDHDRWNDDLTEAEASIETARQQEAERHDSAKQLKDIQRRLAAARRDRGELNQELGQWREEWTLLAAQLPQAARTIPQDAVPCLKLLQDAAMNHELVKERNRRLAEMDRFREQFVVNLKQLAANPLWSGVTSVEQAANHPAAQAAAMVAFLDEQTAWRQRRQALLEEIEQREADLDDLAGVQATLREQRELLCREADCSDPDRLMEMEDASDAKRAAEQQLEALQNQLLDLVEGDETPEQLVEQARPTNQVELEREHVQLQENLDASKAELDELDQGLLEVQVELRAMDGPAHAADLAEKANDVLLELGQAVEQFGRLKAAQVVLQLALEDYRERQQGPLLARVSELFETLTQGSFAGAKVDAAESGAPMLVGLRRHPEEVVPLQGFSDGSADQLYLALRLAWIEHYLDNHESLPLIVDDLLIQFDNERATQTLRVLEGLSKRTQVLFFTHHLHLLELAENELKTGMIRHDLRTPLLIS